MIRIEGRPTQKFTAYCDAVTQAFGPRSKIRRTMESDMQVIVQLDHEEMLLRGVDRYGVPRAPLAESTLANKRRGPGPSLIPRFLSSRFATHVDILWRESSGRRMLVKDFGNILNDRGQPFAQYHLNGTPKMPRRDVGGITPKNMRWINDRFQEFAKDVLHYSRYVR